MPEFKYGDTIRITNATDDRLKGDGRVLQVVNADEGIGPARLYVAFPAIDDAVIVLQENAVLTNEATHPSERFIAHLCKETTYRPYPAFLCSCCRDKTESKDLTLRDLVKIANEAKTVTT